MGHDLGLDLVAQFIHHFRSRSDEFNARIGTCLGEFHVFCQESVSRMDGIYALGLGQCDDFVDTQISAYRSLTLTDLIRFICLGSEQRILIFFGINCYRTDAQLTAGTKYTDCNFTSVCNQYSFEFFNFSHVLSPKKLLDHMNVHLWERY